MHFQTSDKVIFHAFPFSTPLRKLILNFVDKNVLNPIRYSTFETLQWWKKTSCNWCNHEVLKSFRLLWCIFKGHKNTAQPVTDMDSSILVQSNLVLVNSLGTKKSFWGNKKSLVMPDFCNYLEVYKRQVQLQCVRRINKE